MYAFYKNTLRFRINMFNFRINLHYKDITKNVIHKVFH